MSPSDTSIRLAAGQLKHAALTKVDFAENRQFEHGQPVTYRVDHTHTIDFGTAEDADVAVLILDLEIKWETEDPKAIPFDLAITVLGVFTWPKDSRPEDLMRAWLDFNGTYLLWPYARTYVAQVTAMSNHAALTIYTLRVPVPPPLQGEKQQAPPRRPAARPRKKTSTRASQTSASTAKKKPKPSR